MTAELSTVLARLLADEGTREDGAPVGVIASSAVLMEGSFEGAPEVTIDPDDMIALTAKVWYVADLPGLLEEREEWTRAAFATLRKRDAKLVVLGVNSGGFGQDFEAIRNGSSLSLVNSTAISLGRALLALGWFVLDVEPMKAVSKRDIAELSPFASPGASLSRFVDSTVRGLTPELHESRVLLLTARAATDTEIEVDHGYLPQPDVSHEDRPFLSVVIRTQGRRLQGLSEALTALSAQTNDDFEVVLVGHDVEREAWVELEELVGEFADSFSSRVRLVPVTGGGRSTPLNAGFKIASGRYLAMLDDDDVPFAHWVETFASLADSSPGSVLRSVTVDQPTTLAHVSGLEALRAENSLVFPYADHYNLSEHLVGNATPNMAVAVPRGAFHAYGMRFDDSLSTHEDWEFITRAASIFGTASAPEYTALYRWWVGEESSRTVQSDEDREVNVAEVHHRHESNGVLFQGPAVVQLRETVQDRDRLRALVIEQKREFEAKEIALREEWDRGLELRREHFEVLLEAELKNHMEMMEEARQNFERELDALRGNPDEEAGSHAASLAAALADERERLELVRRLGLMLRSRRWAYTAPLRAVQLKRRGGSEIRLDDFLFMSKRELHDAIYNVTRTRSWRMAEALLRRKRQLAQGH